jgi:hypothetical protein
MCDVLTDKGYDNILVHIDILVKHNNARYI